MRWVLMMHRNLLLIVSISPPQHDSSGPISQALMKSFVVIIIYSFPVYLSQSFIAFVSSIYTDSYLKAFQNFYMYVRFITFLFI